MAAKSGDKVKIEYEGKLDDGTIFDSSAKHGKQLEFEVGKKQVIPGFEKAVKGMEPGEEKEVNIPPEEGYGDYNEKLVQKIPRDKLPKEARKGSMLLMQLQTGQRIPVRIIEMDKQEATLDLNHPLAGKKLHFKIRLVEIGH